MSANKSMSTLGSESDNVGPEFQAFLIVMVIIVVLSVTLRFWSRALRPVDHVGHQRFWWDDWVALAAVPVILGQLSVSFVSVSLGNGRHIWTIPQANIDLILRLIFFTYLIYDLGLFLAKTSALLFLQRVFPSHANNRFFNITLRVTYGINVAWLLGIIFGTFFMCNPVAKNWNPSIPGSCGSTSGLFIGSAVPSVLIDLIILILPLPKIWKLQTSRARKFGISIIFVFGYGAVVVSLGRLVQVLTSGDALNLDLTFAGIPVVYWVTAEPPITLLSICVPALLSLGRYLATFYLSPLASKVTLLFSSRRSNSEMVGSTTGDASDAELRHPILLRSREDSSGSTKWQPNPFSKPSEKVLRISPHQDHYSAAVYRAVQTTVMPDDLPAERIRVDSDVKVIRDERHYKYQEPVWLDDERSEWR